MLLALVLAPPPAAERLFVYFEKDPGLASGGALKAIRLPSGAAFEIPRSRTGVREGDVLRNIRVSPRGDLVAFVVTRGKGRILKIHRLASGATESVPLIAKRPEGLEWDGTGRLELRYESTGRRLTPVGEGWRAEPTRFKRAWPTPTDPKLARFEAALRRREPGLGHAPLRLSPSGDALAAYALLGSLTLDRGDSPVRFGYVRRTLVAYDARTLKRRFAAPPEEESQDDPPATMLLGWVGDAMATIGPTNEPFPQRIVLFGPKGRRTYPVHDATAFSWSLAGGEHFDRPSDEP